ncbi:MAG: hypothetical protein Q8K30_01880 [Candidatus Gracilibacteria bacterium]|nr:hypothetical protein [Candidatus Gracilibacteria bacterium]
MNKLPSAENCYIIEEDLQSILDSDFMNYTSSMVRYVLNPQDKLPPKLKENNLGFIFASNLLNLAANIDFKSGIITVNKEYVVANYKKIQDLLEKEYKPKDNLCYYPLHIMETSNSSKFIHGLPYVEILEKWNGEFEQNPLKLKVFIEKLRDKLHIDSDLEIVSAKVVGRLIHLRIKNNEFDVTIPLGYSTKHEIFTTEDGESIELNDSYGNIFSPQGAEYIRYYLNDEEIINSINTAHKQGAKYMINFFSWRAPEYVTKENYKNYYYFEVEPDLGDEEAVLKYDGVLHHFDEGQRIIIKQVNDRDGNFLSTTQDQILPDYGNRQGNVQEQKNYEYWMNTYKSELYRLVNFGVDSFRIDLAHGFRKNNDCNMLNTLISDLVDYADKKLNKKVFFILETYDFSNFGGTNPASFRDWNNNLPYPAVKVYHKETEDKLTSIHDYQGVDNLIDDLKWLFQDIRGIYGEMMAASTFDDYTLYSIAQKSGIDFKHILEMEMFLGKAGYNILSLDRDFLGENGEIIPTVPGGCESHYGTGKFITHTFSSKDEFQLHAKTQSQDIYERSESIKLLQEINKFPDIKGLSINKEKKQLVFIFIDNSKRIFDFSILKDGGAPYTVESEQIPEIISQELVKDLLKLEQLERDLSEKLKDLVTKYDGNKEQLPHVYTYDFWKEFVNYIKHQSWNENGIAEWDTFKQEAYFILNREKLITNFLSYKNIDLSEKEELENIKLNTDNVTDEKIELKKQIKELRANLENEVRRIIEKSIKKTYPDLLA